MTLLLDDPGFMDGMWESAHKTSDNRAIYSKNEIENLWHGGFVDTENISLEEWEKIVSPYKGKDDNYYFDKDQLYSLDTYRYKGEVRIPFDPMNLQNGKYSSDSIDQLFQLSIKPSCGLTYDSLLKFAEEFKKEYEISDGVIGITDRAKFQLIALLEEYPSPLRNLEVMLDGLFSLAEQYLEKQGIDINKIASEAQKSLFTSTPTSAVEKKAVGLKDLTKAKAKKEETEIDEDKLVDLKSIRRSKRGTRG